MMKFFYSLPVVLVYLCISCSDDKEDNSQTITIDSEQLAQTLYADATQSGNTVGFTTTAAWTSYVRYDNATKAGEDGQSDWLRISPDHGDTAGQHEVSIVTDVNTTREDRDAAIHIRCGNMEITITVVQKGTKDDGTVPETALSMDELYILGAQRYSTVSNMWLQIDNGYSTLAARQSITATSSFLYDFWKGTYESILCSNLMLERLDAEDNLSEIVKSIYRNEALDRRANGYFYLKTLFDGVPLTVSSDMSEEPLSRTPGEEIVDYIYDNYLDAVDVQYVDSVKLLRMAVIHLQEGEYSHAANASGHYIALYLFYDTNNDGVIDGQDPDSNMKVFLAHLLFAEASLVTGNLAEAINAINVMCAVRWQAPLVAVSANTDEIYAAIRSEYSRLTDTGMNFLNAVRWGTTQGWGKYMLFPVPQSEIDRNPLLTQNEGW